MRAPNHITGGVLFTGLFCSFYNINIFSTPLYLITTVASSIAADIDLPTSTIGKIFKPVSKFLERKYGHRTITHSLIFLVVSSIIVYVFSSLFSANNNIFYIFLFAYLSHILFDMLTVQGVAFFYPFVKNPCVIPANPDYRLNNKFTTQLAMFSVFTLMLGFCFPLFSKGFWNSFNSSFTTIEHLHSSYKHNSNLAEVKYKVRGNRNISGTGYLIYAENSKAFIFNNSEIVELTNKDLIESLNINPTSKKLSVRTLNINNVSLDSLNLLLKNKILINSDLACNLDFVYYSGNVRESGKKLKADYIYNLQLSPVEKDTLKIYDKRLKLKELEFKLSLDQLELNNLVSSQKLIACKLKSNINDFDREHLIKSNTELMQKIKAYDIDTMLFYNINVLRQEIKIISYNDNINKPKFSGVLTTALVN